jgi:hypothetical protein
MLKFHIEREICPAAHENKDAPSRVPTRLQGGMRAMRMNGQDMSCPYKK